GIESGLPGDALVLCSFGDASANHCTALSGFSAARYVKKRGNPCPVLFLCEDNGIGISVDTPKDWMAETFANQTNLRYVRASGEIDAIWDVANEAIESCRGTKTPTFLHLEVTRLWGHAGSDVETTYRTTEEIEAIERRDPLLRSARRLVETGA